MSLCLEGSEIEGLAKELTVGLKDAYKKQMRNTALELVSRRGIDGSIFLALHVNRLKIMGEVLRELSDEISRSEYASGT